MEPSVYNAKPMPRETPLQASANGAGVRVVSLAKAVCAAWFQGDATITEKLMDLSPNPKIEELRRDFQKFIAAEAPKIHTRNGIRAAENKEELEAMKVWLRRLFEENFIGRDWPVEYGGLDDSDPSFSLMITTEIEKAGVPHPLGFWQLPAKALLKFGTQEQKDEFLPRIRAVDWVWCQLFSEPGAGSDLASLTTRAQLDGDRYLVNGQKVWNTQAQWADYGFMLARTSTEPKKHDGISFMLINLRQQGVDVRPIREITGTWDFNEVFLDNAEVPVINRIGEEGKGWLISTQALAQERIHTAAYGIKVRVALDALIKRAQSIPQLSDVQRHKLVELHAACNASNLLGHAIATREITGKRRDADPAIAKLFFSEVNLEISEFALELLSESSLYEEGDELTIDSGRWPDMWLYAPALTISGGSSEVMRNIISERVLNMPRL